MGLAAFVLLRNFETEILQNSICIRRNKSCWRNSRRDTDYLLDRINNSADFYSVFLDSFWWYSMQSVLYTFFGKDYLIPTNCEHRSHSSSNITYYYTYTYFCQVYLSPLFTIC